jgi:hypothetical protein
MQAYVAELIICMSGEILSDGHNRKAEFKMIGVILWSDTLARKAVVWCEDQGDLAFLGSGCVQHDYLGQLTAGDLLEFDVEIEGNLRCVNNPTLLKGYEMHDVAASLVSTLRAPKATMEKALALSSPNPINVASGTPSEIVI